MINVNKEEIAFIAFLTIENEVKYKIALAFFHS